MPPPSYSLFQFITKNFVTLFFAKIIGKSLNYCFYNKTQKRQKYPRKTTRRKTRQNNDELTLWSCQFKQLLTWVAIEILNRNNSLHLHVDFTFPYVPNKYIR